jgi:hypothetical protein
MAGFLTPEGEAILARTIREWASSGCNPYPCGLEVWLYVNAISNRPADPLPDHTSRKAMLELLQQEGGLEAYARRLMLSIGWKEVLEPMRGDVGVVDFPGLGFTCAICLGSKWMAKGPHHVLTVAAPHRAAWSFEGCHKPLPPPLSPQLD